MGARRSGLPFGQQAGSQCQRLLAGVNAAIELRVFHGGQHRGKAWAGRVACGDQVMAAQQRPRAHGLGGQCGQTLSRVVVELELAAAGKAIQTMQRKVLVEILQPHKALEGGVLHLHHVGKAHVIIYKRQHLRTLAIAEAQARHQLGGNGRADLHVAVKTNAVGSAAECCRLARIMQQRSPGERGRNSGGKAFQQQKGVSKDIAFGVVLRRLLDALHASDLRQHLGQQAERVEQLEGAAGAALGQHLGQLVAHALLAHLVNLRGVGADGRGRVLFDLVSEARGKTGGAQHAELVFGKAAAGVANGADDAVSEVLTPADEVVQLAVCGVGMGTQGIEQEAVDGEVAALDVHLRAFGVEDALRMAAVEVGSIGSEGGNLDVAAGPGLAQGLEWHQHDSELCAHGTGPGKKRHHLVGTGRGGHVVVGRRAAQQKIAHRAARPQGLMPRRAQPFHRNQCRLTLHDDIVELNAQNLTRYAGCMTTRATILGLESSCDETAAAIVRGGDELISSVVASQIATHSPYGGVVPELASREHLRNLLPVTRAALEQAGIQQEQLDAIAITSGPGLAGALLTGVSFAKALAWALNKPLIAVNHIEGHIHAVLLEHSRREKIEFPLLALVVSGGHTHLFLAEQTGTQWSYRNVGHTRDDAAGEAFDKTAKLLGLGYPGGPLIDRLARHGDPKAVPFTFAQMKHHARQPSKRGGASEDNGPRFDFSYSGIKTAVLRYVETNQMFEAIERRRPALLALEKPTDDQLLEHCDRQTLDLIASFQAAVVGDLTRRTLAACEEFGVRTLLVTGGVAANSALRESFERQAANQGVVVRFPSRAMSTDNAAMVAAAAHSKWLAGDFAPLDLTAEANLTLR